MQRHVLAKQTFVIKLLRLMQTLRKGPVFNAPILKIKDMNATVLKTLEKK